MAVIHPRIHWGTREVDWTWVPETTDEITGVARRMAAEAMGVLGFVFFAGAAIIVNSKVSEGGLGLLGMAAATGVAYALMVYMFHPVSGGHLNPAVDRKSTRLNSSHRTTSYAVFCLKKKTQQRKL